MNPDLLRLPVEASGQLTAWALGIGGASIVALASGSYRRPVRLRWRLAYWLFLPGWAFVGLSVYFGNRIQRSFLAAQLGKAERVREIAENINSFYSWQHWWFIAALVCFGVWLLIYLLYWIHFERSSDPSA